MDPVRLSSEKSQIYKRGKTLIHSQKYLLGILYQIQASVLNCVLYCSIWSTNCDSKNTVLEQWEKSSLFLLSPLVVLICWYVHTYIHTNIKYLRIFNMSWYKPHKDKHLLGISNISYKAAMQYFQAFYSNVWNLCHSEQKFFPWSFQFWGQHLFLLSLLPFSLPLHLPLFFPFFPFLETE